MPSAVRRRLLQQLGGVERCVRDRKHVQDVLNAHRAAFPVLEQVHLLDLAGAHDEALSLAQKHQPGSAEEVKFAEEVARRHAAFEKRRREERGAFTDGGVLRKQREPVSVISSANDALRVRDRPFVYRPPVVGDEQASGGPCVPSFLRSFEGVAEFLGDLRLPTRLRQTGSDEAGPQRQSDQGDSCLWAHLADAPAGQERTFADMMLAAAVRSQSGVKMKNDQFQSPLVFDFSLWRTRLGRKFAAALAPYPLFPHVDFLAAAQTAAMPVSGSAFPTLFANFDAPTRGAGPHVDFSGTHFYQLVCCGKKRYRLASPRSLPLLQPLYLDDLSSPWLPTDALRVDGHETGSGARSSVEKAVLDLVPIYETEVRAGEAIFVPSGWAHEVENVEATIAISGNFVDRTNYEEVLGQLECEARCGFEGPRVLGEELRDLDVAKLEEEQLKLMVGLGRAGGGALARRDEVRETNAQHSAAHIICTPSLISAAAQGQGSQHAGATLGEKNEIAAKMTTREASHGERCEERVDGSPKAKLPDHLARKCSLLDFKRIGGERYTPHEKHYAIRVLKQAVVVAGALATFRIWYELGMS